MSNPFSQAPSASVAGGLDQAERVSAFLTKVYGWMFAGLAITAMVALYVASSPTLIQTVVANRWMFYGIIFAELGLVWYVSARVATLAPGTAAALFATYSALNGVTLSIILLVYTGSSIGMAFLTTSAMFGALAIYGSVAKRSLAGVGQFAFMGLIGIIVASVIGFFWHSDTLQFVISVCGVIVFTGLTMWDAQRLKNMALQVDGDQVGSYAIGGALSLYLDFINMFLFMLRFMGRSRN